MRFEVARQYDPRSRQSDRKLKYNRAKSLKNKGSNSKMMRQISASEHFQAQCLNEWASLKRLVKLNALGFDVRCFIKMEV